MTVASAGWSPGPPSDPAPGAGASAGPASAIDVFGAQLPLAQRFAEILATDGITRGLLGPREVPRLWDRHVINSALLADLVPRGMRVVDVGSGAGLPGLPMAICRPDLTLQLVEPMARRTTFLRETVQRLELSRRVAVLRGRADDREVLVQAGAAEWVVARAVAPLDRLVTWCLPLLASTGTLLALKGATVHDEVAEHRAALDLLGAGEISVSRLGETVQAESTWVVSVRRTRRGRT